MCGGRSATCPSMVSWAWCDHSLPGGDALEQQAGQLEGGNRKIGD